MPAHTELGLGLGPVVVIVVVEGIEIGIEGVCGVKG
jgi:hypothetical protein